jgi:hypothetical protein
LIENEALLIRGFLQRGSAQRDGRREKVPAKGKSDRQKPVTLF